MQQTEKKILKLFKRYLMGDEYVKENDLTNPFGNLIAMFRKGYLLGQGLIGQPNDIDVEKGELLNYTFSNEHGKEVTVIGIIGEWCIVSEEENKAPYSVPIDFVAAIKAESEYETASLKYS